MKKIFLTSGIVVCMACPAFATGESFSGHTSGTETGACVEPQLGVFYGDTTLTAQWTANYTGMTLNENIGTTTATGGAENETHAPALYLVGGDGVYHRSGNNDTDYSFTKIAVGEQALNNSEAGLPDGINVNYTLHQDKPTGATGTVTPGTSTAAHRSFLGYFAHDATDTTTPYIASDGKLTTEGNAAAANYNNANPWKAQYSTVHPTVTSPFLYGYAFNGWATSQANANEGTVISDFANHNIGQSTDIYASWTANEYTVTYGCGEGTGTAPSRQTVTYDSTTFSWAGNNDTESGTGCKVPGKHFTGWTCTVASGVGNGTVNGQGADIITNSGAGDLSAATAPGDRAGTAVDRWTVGNLVNGATISCTAQFAVNTINIAWDGNNATSFTAPENNIGGTTSCTYNSSVVLPTAPSRTGYTFSGWKVGSSSTSGGEQNQGANLG